MDDTEMEIVRGEFLEYARKHASLVEDEIVQYWKFLRSGGSMKTPLLYISKPGRNVVHLKNFEVNDPRWTLIEAGDPKKVGRLYEIRIQGSVEDVRAAFYSGFNALVVAPF
jgi:hypothetical protein